MIIWHDYYYKSAWIYAEFAKNTNKPSIFCFFFIPQLATECIWTFLTNLSSLFFKEKLFWQLSWIPPHRLIF